jgi:hypothetical protein
MKPTRATAPIEYLKENLMPECKYCTKPHNLL